ncbi:MAG: hypothetical protein ACKV2V_26600, partial [Blastocatellia bacterium]
SQFTFPVTPGQLAFGQSVQKVFLPLTVTNGSPPPSPGVLVGAGVNPVGVTSEYSILNSDGTPSGQTVPLAPVFSPAPITPDQAPVTVLTPGIVSAKTVSPLMFTSFPVTLNYTLKGTNTGNTDLAVDLRDAKLKTMIAAPPAGVTVTGPVIQTGAGFAAGVLNLDLADDIVASFSLVNMAGGVSPMAQVNVSLTIANLAGFAALADGLNIPQSYKSTNTMIAQGFPLVIDGCVNGAVGGAAAVMSQSSAVTMYQPPCLISLKKEVSCGPVNPGSVFGSTITTLPGAAVVFRYMVTNGGGDPLNNVVITDNGVTSPLFNVGTILPGETKTFDVAANASIATGALVSTANATGDCQLAGGSVTATPQSTTVAVINPQVSCAKSVNGVTDLTGYQAGTPLTFVLTGTNAATSGTPLNLQIDDPILRNIPGVSCRLADNTPVTLPYTFTNVAPGASVTINCTVNFASEAAFLAVTGGQRTLANTMSLSGTLPAGTTICAANSVAPPPYNCTSRATVTLAPPPCLISLTKQVSCGPLHAGSVFSSTLTTLPGAAVVYRYIVTNSGGDTLSNVVINDNGVTSPLFNVGALPAGQSKTIDVAAIAPFATGPVVSTATASGGCALAGGSVATTPQSTTVTVINPQVSCAKSVNGQSDLTGYQFGTPLTYLLTGTNAATSGTPLDLQIKDPIISAAPGVSCRLANNTPVTLPYTFTNVAPGASVAISCTLSFASEGAFLAASGGQSTLINTMTLSGTLPAGTNICANSASPAPPYGCSSQASVTVPPPPQTGTGAACLISRCIGPDCQSGTPGDPPSPGAPVSDQKAGSILFFNYYASSATQSTNENTRINLTNTAQGGVYVHMYFIDGASCSVADSYVCLSGNQTVSLLMADLDPGVRGYAIAVAVDGAGCPIKWNYLIGDEYFKLSSGHMANLGAEAIAALTENPAGCAVTSTTVKLRLDGVQFNYAPVTLAVDALMSPEDGNSTMLILNRVGGDLTSTAAEVGPVFGLLYDDQENPYSFGFTASECQVSRLLSSGFPRTTPRLGNLITAGRAGWMKLSSAAGHGLLGAVVVRNSFAATASNAYNHGHNLHKLSFTSTAEFIVPVIPPKG